MRIVICMPTGTDGIQDDAVIRDALLTVANRVTMVGETSGEFEAGDNKRNMVTFEVDDEDEGSFTAFLYEDDGITTADLATYDTQIEAVAFAKSRNWDEVVNDITGEVVYRK